jgi:flagellar protein FliL
MSAAPAANPADAPKKGSKKLILIVVGVLLALLLAGAGAFLLMKKNMAQSDGEAGDETEQVDGAAADKAAEKGKASSSPPIFVQLDPFIVNLADRETERFAQIGLTLQVEDAKIGEDMKLYMPAIRNAILLILSRKTAEDLLTAEGKVQLAGEIQRGAARAMGFDVPEPAAEQASTVQPADGDEEAPAPKKRKKKKAAPHNPILQVHYANFIIQ